MMEKARRGVPGSRLHSSSHKRRGSMGMTRSTRYTLVPRRRASSSSGLSALWAPWLPHYFSKHNLQLHGKDAFLSLIS